MNRIVKSNDLNTIVLMNLIKNKSQNKRDRTVRSQTAEHVSLLIRNVRVSLSAAVIIQ